MSLASVWELQIKMQLGKIVLRLPLADPLRDQQQENGLLLEAVTLEDILDLSAKQNGKIIELRLRDALSGFAFA